MSDILTEKLIRDVSERIKTRDDEIASRLWVIIKRGRLDYVDKADVVAELEELYNDLEGTVTL